MKLFGYRIMRQKTLERVASMVKNGNSEDRDIASELLLGSRKAPEPQFRIVVERDVIKLEKRTGKDWGCIERDYGDFTAETHRNMFIGRYKERINQQTKPFENITLYY